MTTPLATVKKRFENKAKLVEAVKALMTDDLWLPRLSGDRGGSRGIEHVSNAKLLRLHETLSALKKDFGSRSKLIAKLLEVEKRSGDEGYKKRLESYPAPRLLDAYKSAERRAKKATGG
jgi:hypothetical protein